MAMGGGVKTCNRAHTVVVELHEGTEKEKIRYRTFEGHGGGGETRERRTTIAEGATRGRRTMANAQTLGAKPAAAVKNLSACGGS